MGRGRKRRVSDSDLDESASSSSSSSFTTKLSMKNGSQSSFVSSSPQNWDKNTKGKQALNNSKQIASTKSSNEILAVKLPPVEAKSLTNFNKIEEDDLMSNAVLLVGPQHTRVKVMKELLQIQSPILRARLSDAGAAVWNELNENEAYEPEEELQIFNFEDLDVEPFQNFLKYVYSTERNWNSSMLINSHVTIASGSKHKSDTSMMTSVQALRHLAIKLGLKELEKDIDHQMKSLLDPDLQRPVVAAIQQNKRQNWKSHKKKKMSDQIILNKKSQSHPSTVHPGTNLSLKEMPKFDNISKPQDHFFYDEKNYVALKAPELIEILKMDELGVGNELELFNLVVKWGEAHCQKDGSEDVDDLLKKTLDPILPYIRFTQMTQNEFMAHVYPRQLVDDDLLAVIMPIHYWKQTNKNMVAAVGSESIVAARLKMDKPRKYTKIIPSQAPISPEPISISHPLISMLPTEILEKILNFLTKKDILRCRLVSKQFGQFIQDTVPLELKIDDSNLNKISRPFGIASGGKKRFHPFSTIIVSLKKFREKQSTCLLHFLELSKAANQNRRLSKNKSDDSRKVFLELTMRFVSVENILVPFLTKAMLRAPGLKISLNFSKISDQKSSGSKNVKKRCRHDNTDDDDEAKSTESDSHDRSSDDDDSFSSEDDQNLKFKSRQICSPSPSRWTMESSKSKSFFQIHCVNFKYLNTDAELNCLIQIWRMCPNLMEISIGDFVRRTHSEDLDLTANIVTFLRTVCGSQSASSHNSPRTNRKKLIISSANMGLHWLTTDFFMEFKNEDVGEEDEEGEGMMLTFKKINCEFDPRVKTLEFVDLFSDDLEEIYDLQISPFDSAANEAIFAKKNSFQKLTVLSINCNVTWLDTILQKCPTLESLFWSEVRDASIDDDREENLGLKKLPHLALPNLSRLFVRIKRKENLNFLKLLALASPKVTSFGFEIRQDKKGKEWDHHLGAKACQLYTFFPKIEHLDVCENKKMALQVFTGITNQPDLVDEWEDRAFEDRPAYIGNLKYLKSLNLGLMDYEELAKGWKWCVNFAIFSHAICHLSTLEKIVLPPIEFSFAKKILRYISSHMGTVKYVECQLWDVDTDNSNDLNGSMVTSQFDDLVEYFEDSFESLVARRILDDDNVHFMTKI